MLLALKKGDLVQETDEFRATETQNSDGCHLTSVTEIPKIGRNYLDVKYGSRILETFI